MADNVTIDEGSTTEIATEDVGGVQLPKTLLVASAGHGLVHGGTDIEVAVGGRYLDTGTPGDETSSVATSAAPTMYPLTDYYERALSGSYVDGDVVGATLETFDYPLSGGGLARWQYAMVYDLEQVHPELDIILLGDPASQESALVNSSPYVPTEAELQGVVGVIRVSAADYTDVGTYAFAAVPAEVLGRVTGEYTAVIVARSTFVLTGDGFSASVTGEYV